jgi:hypothetical protein
VYITNNTVVGFKYMGLSCYTASRDSGDISNYYITNNIIHNCGLNGSGTALNYGSSGGTWTNGDGSWTDGRPITIDYNIISAGADGNTRVMRKGINTTYSSWKSSYGCQDNPGASVENEDPDLDVSYKIDSTNDPPYDEGVSMSAYIPSSDYDGDTRPQGTAWDIGADEYAEIEPPIPPPGRLTITSDAVGQGTGTLTDLRGSLGP